jgi:PadR family transcriptional regulator PadR
LVKSNNGASPELEFERWSQEIRRGAISLAILAVISMGESYGYNIMQKLEEQYNALQIEPSTTYPLLRRLEKRGILEGNWVKEGGRRRRLYYVTKEGKRILKRMVGSWRDLNGQLVALLKEANLL